MKQILSYFLLLLIFGFFCNSYAQDYQPSLKTVSLDQEDALLAQPSQITVSPGDTLKFIAKDGNFSVFIPEAVRFLRIRTTNLSFLLDGSETAESDLYIVRDIDADLMQCPYSIYSLGNDSWPLAPPRIIIKAN